MTCARLRLDLPEETWAGDVSREHPDAEFTIRAALPGDAGGVALVSIVGPDLERVRETLGDHQALTGLSVLECSEAELTVQFETTRPTILRAARESGLPIQPPIEIADGEAIIDVEGEHERLSALARRLEDLDVGVDVVFVGRNHHTDQLLTETQQELLMAAIEQGYYDTPRRCTLTELAENRDIAKSTCSEVLQRAEETVMKQFAGDLPTGPAVIP